MTLKNETSEIRGKTNITLILSFLFTATLKSYTVLQNVLQLYIFITESEMPVFPNFWKNCCGLNHPATKVCTF